MGSRGPKPLPAATLAARGSRRTKARAAEERAASAAPAAYGPPPRPAFLPDHLQATFDQLAATLPNLRPTDGPLLYAVASAVADQRAADAALADPKIATDATARRVATRERSSARRVLVDVQRLLERRDPAPTAAPGDDAFCEFTG